mgnify:CR=1 FL=1
MTEPKVLLLYPPLQFMPQEAPRPDGGLGLLYLAGALEDAGIEVDVIDAALGDENHNLESTFYRRVEQDNGLIRIGLSFEEIAALVADRGYNIVGIHSNFTPQTKMVLQTARVVKKVSRDIVVIVGGVNARNLIEYFLSSGQVDFVATTESEKILVKLVRQWSLGRSPNGVDGIAFLEQGTVVVEPPHLGSVLVNLDELPMPRWHKLPLAKYARVSGPHGDLTLPRGNMYASIMTSRGCPFRCSYCHISVEKEDPQASGGIGALRLKSVDRVIEEVMILKNLGVSRLYFEDDSLLAHKKRVKQIFGRVADLGLSIADVNGVNLVHFLVRNKDSGKLEPDREYFEILKTAGFDHIVFPVESGSQRVLDTYATAKLNLATMDVVELVKVAVAVGIECPVNMMIGFPDETEAEILQTVELAKKLVDAGAYYCSFFFLTPFPGSRIFHYAVAHGHIDGNFDPDDFNIHRVVMKNTAVSPERLIELKDWAWRTVNRRDYVEARLRLSIGGEL